jgi:DNA-binding NarL/FixJ family response regulator
VREGIRHVLEGERGFAVVAEAGQRGRRGAPRREHQPDVVVLDVSMPGESGLRATPSCAPPRPRRACSS